MGKHILRKARVLLVSPQASLPKAPFFGETVASLPIGLLSIATALKEEGIEAKVISLEGSENPLKKLSNETLSFRPTHVAFETFSTSISRAAFVSSEIRALSPETILVAGGYHATANPKETLDLTGADAVIVGDGEKSLIELVKSGKSWKEKGIAGVAFLSKEGKFAMPGKKPAFGSVPRFLDRRLLDPASFSPEIQKGSTIIVASKGCPYRCGFCQAPFLSKGEYFERSVKDVISEIKACSTLGYAKIAFSDNIFGLRRKWLRSFCKEMVLTGLSEKISWSCSRRVDGLSKKELAEMKKAGCFAVSVGVESGSPRVLRLMRKGITVPQIRSAFRRLKEAKMISSANFIIGYPGETEKDIELTKKIVLEIDPDILKVFIFIPLPMTPAFGKKGPGTGRLLDASNSEGTVRFPDGYLVSKRREIFLSFYLGRKRLLRTVKSLFFGGSFFRKIEGAFYNMTWSSRRRA